MKLSHLLFKTIGVVSCFLSGIGFCAQAQENRRESQEIIIRQQGGNNKSMTIEINGDEVSVNGKPLKDFRDSDVTINKKKIIIAEGGNNSTYNEWENNNNSESFSITGTPLKRTFLGVATSQIQTGIVQITGITPGSPAEKAGLQVNDIITQINDSKITSPALLSETIKKMKAGDEIKLYYKREGKKEKSMTITLSETTDNNSMSFSMATPNGRVRTFRFPITPDGEGQSLNKDEIILENDISRNFLNEEGNSFNFSFSPKKQRLGVKIQDTEEGTGVKIVSVEESSAAQKAGLKADDIIVKMGDKKINNTDEAREWLQENKEKTSYTIRATRNGTEIQFDIVIPKQLKTTNL